MYKYVHIHGVKGHLESIKSPKNKMNDAPAIYKRKERHDSGLRFTLYKESGSLQLNLFERYIYFKGD